MPLIEIEDAVVRYGHFAALDGLTCTIEEGTIGLLGPNGAGKSTLLKTLLGFNRAVEGSISIFGLEMPKNALEVRQKLGYMPEREAVSPKVSAVAFLTHCGRLFGMNRVDAMERTHEVLNYVGLGENRYRKMETYSTGMLQRVKLGQALVHDPKLLLLDEPTNGLDPEGRTEMLDLIREIAAERGVTVILSSHLLPDVQYVCDHIIMINRGKMVQSGSLESLTTKDERQIEVRVRDQLDAYENGLDQMALKWKDLQNGNLLITMSNGFEDRRLFELARQCGTQVRHFQEARHSLAEVFVEAIDGTKADSAALFDEAEEE